MTNAMMEIVNRPTEMPPLPVLADDDDHIDAWNRLHAGMLITDRALKVRSMNVAAKAIIERNDGICLADAHLALDGTHDGNPGTAGCLEQAIDTATRGQVGAVAVWSAKHDAPYLVTVVQLENRSTAGAPQQFLISVADPVVVPAEPVLKCARALGLTHGEASLALALVRGETVTENAKRRGVSIHTVRSQLRNIRDKLGLSRQSQLISWLTRAALCTPPYPQALRPSAATTVLGSRPQTAILSTWDAQDRQV